MVLPTIEESRKVDELSTWGDELKRRVDELEKRLDKLRNNGSFKQFKSQLIK